MQIIDDTFLLTAQSNRTISFDNISNFKTAFQLLMLQKAEIKYIPIPILNVCTVAIQATASKASEIDVEEIPHLL
jgi:hypothetical protein